MDLDTEAFEQALESSLETMDSMDGVDENPLLALETELDQQLASIPDIQLQPDEESESFKCPHLASALAIEAHKSNILRKYKSAVAWAAHNSATGERPRKKRKVSEPTCGTCGLTLHRPFICLHCPYAGCWRGGHIQNHMKDLGHHFCADVKSGSIFCSECDNIIHDKTMEDIYHSVTLVAEEKETHFASAKKRREPFRPWMPDEKEVAALRDTTPLSCHGRRGLLNLGQTCFLNVVLQSLLHNPLLRNYFLSDKHNSKTCKNKDCMCCEMDTIFTEVYSESTTPFGPTSLLATTWLVSTMELAGDAQQDAHEFFMLALNQVHTKSRGSTNVSCICIVHNVFAGQLQSDIKCEKCGNVTSTTDPLLDISLELKPKPGKGKGTDNALDNTLAGCLRRYTQQEKLSTKYTCSSCHVTSPSATKRLSIRKLPPVLAIQLKRFEYKGQDKTAAKKIETFIRFPAAMNMAPYSTLAVRMHSEKGNKGAVSAHHPLGPDILYEYDLFAVINHQGKMDTGHYTSYARSQGEWYHFDDHKVTHSSLESVLKSTAYMLFYVKKHLDYKPYSRPSYVLTRETEAVREREKEREKEAARMKEVEDALLATV